MSDPSFIIHDVLSQLYLDDDNTTQATVEMQVASAKIDAMRLANEIDPFYQGNEIPSDSIAFGM